MTARITVNRIDHTAVVVADMDEAIERWLGLTGAGLGTRAMVPTQHVEIAMLHVGDTTIELIRPLDAESGVGRFLARRGESVHHVGLAVDDIRTALADLDAQGIELIDKEPREGPEGLIAFIHPRSTAGVLLELVERGPI